MKASFRGRLSGGNRGTRREFSSLGKITGLTFPFASQETGPGPGIAYPIIDISA